MKQHQLWNKNEWTVIWAGSWIFRCTLNIRTKDVILRILLVLLTQKYGKCTCNKLYWNSKVPERGCNTVTAFSHTSQFSRVLLSVSKGTRSKEVNCIADSKGTKMSKCFYYTRILILASTIFACEDRHTARSDNWCFKKCYPDASSWPIYTYWTNFLRLPCT